VAIDKLKPAAWNPRTISKGQFKRLQGSLLRDPKLLWHRPILAMADGTIYAGNMRFEAAKALPSQWRVEHYGSDGLPAELEDVTPEQARERAIRDNGSWGEWIEQDLAEILYELATRNIDLDTLGFDPDELERLLALVSGTAPDDAEAFDPTPPTHPETRPGDLLILGPHRLVCGDAREPLTWALLMESGAADVAGARADMMWTDPPYGVDPGVNLKAKLVTAGVHGPTAFQGNRPEDVAPLLKAVFPNADHWLKEGAPIYIAAAYGPMMLPFMTSLLETWHHAQTIAWVKNSINFAGAYAGYHNQHEAIIYAWKSGEPRVWVGGMDKSGVIDDRPDLSGLARHELVTLLKQAWNDLKTDVISEDKTRHNDLHPTMKPTRLIRQMLGNSSRRGDVVLDPFAGSGSTMVAAQLMDRRAAMIEIEPRFCDVIARRWLELNPANEAHRVRQDNNAKPVTMDVKVEVET
jgi:DNA modification methylase